MDNKIKFLFDETYKIAQRVQKIDQLKKEINGKAIWGKIEEKVKDIAIDNLEYNETLKPIYTEMDKIINKYDMNRDNNEFKIISNHFFMQLKNLVTTKSNFKIQLNRVLQLAYNVGQLSVFLENTEKYDDIEKTKLNEINEMVMKYRLDVLDTYISIENQNKINKVLVNISFDFRDFNDLEKIGKNQEGGNVSNYKQKYLKYKQKYLKLKNFSK